MSTPDPFRLQRTVLPHRYELEVEPDLEAGTFRGSVTISVDVLEPVDTIALNAVDLSVGRTLVTGPAGPVDTSVENEPSSERIHLRLSRTVPAGKADIRLDFEGTLNDRLVGFYRSTFEHEGTTHTLAVTQFESTHARRAFPCFDEPDMKAVFSITLIVAENMFAVSNAAELDRAEAGAGRTRVRFADTMSMSTYLVAFVVGPLESTAVRTVSGMAGPIPLRVVHPPGRAHLCDFALDVADAGIRFLESYYDLPYPSDKIDLVAVADFAFGAMENLGCITFREVLLLVDPERATQQELQRVADVINHELAHMWFGDLVTMDWWNGIWLNEAFATFMEVSASNSFRPEWDCWTSFGLARSEAFDTDTLRNTRPIEFAVHSPADAEAMFDVLTYEKGASVVRMLEQYLGPESFRSGIARYLRRHAFGNTRTTDLWDALEEVSGEPVRRIMDSWIFQGGHPCVTVTPTEDGVHLHPERSSFGAEPNGEPQGAAERDQWPIPMVLTTTVGQQRTEHRVLLDGPQTLQLDGRPTSVQANTGASGFYRTALPPEMTAALLTGNEASAVERFTIVDDSWWALLSGRISLADLEVVLRLASWRETDPSVWRRLAGAARAVHRLCGPDSTRGRNLTRDMTVGPLPHLPQLIEVMSGDQQNRWRDLRGVLFSLLGTVGEDAATRLIATDVFASGEQNGHSADVALTAAALDVVAATGDATQHAAIEARWRASATPQEGLRYLNALADTGDPNLFEHTLVLASTEVRTQNAPYLLRRALAHPLLGGQAWDHVAERWDTLLERLPSSAVPRMLEGIRHVTDQGLALRISAFLDGHPLEGSEQVVAQHVERMLVSTAAADRLRIDAARPN